MKIGFIGAGNMGGAILNGYIAKEKARKADVSVFDADAEKLAEFQKSGIRVCANIAALTETSDMVIIGVKPNNFEAVLPEIARAYKSEKVLISMAAGVKISFIEQYFKDGAKIIRIMPNTPAMVGEGMTSVSRNSHITDEDMKQALAVLTSVGKAHEVPEELIHCVIGVSGSSPAYTYMYIEALANAAAENGMDEKQALLFAAQSVLGAAKMVLETGISPETLRINVCSPGGTTMEAVRTLQEKGFAEVIEAGFTAAVEKSKKMTK